MMKPIVLNKKIGSIVLIFSLLCFPIAAAAEADDGNVEEIKPNVYKDDPINLDPESLLENKKEVGNIPEEIKDLTFEKEEDAEKESLKESLFANASAEDNTISAKAKEYNLFSSKNTSYKKERTEQTVSEKSSDLQWFYLLLIGVGVVVLFAVLIPCISPQPSVKK